MTVAHLDGSLSSQGTDAGGARSHQLPKMTPFFFSRASVWHHQTWGVNTGASVDAAGPRTSAAMSPRRGSENLQPVDFQGLTPLAI